MAEVTPSRLTMRGSGMAGPSSYHDTLLRHGEVVGVIYPEDSGSLTKQFIEYEVLVTERTAKTAGTRLYQHCFLASDLAGRADYSFRTLRAGDRGTKSGLGSKVLILCLNAEMTNPIILSGIRDERDSDRTRKAKGHNLESVFNGVDLSINDDGSYSVVMRGPTKPDGKLDTARGSEDAAGTTLKVEADGSFEVHTKDGAQYVRVDHPDGRITVSGTNDVVVQAKLIHVGKGATEHAVLGDTLLQLMTRLIGAIMKETHLTPSGTSSPPINISEYAAIQADLVTMLSHFVTVGKDP